MNNQTLSLGTLMLAALLALAPAGVAQAQQQQQQQQQPDSLQQLADSLQQTAQRLQQTAQQLQQTAQRLQQMNARIQRQQASMQRSQQQDTTGIMQQGQQQQGQQQQGQQQTQQGQQQQDTTRTMQQGQQQDTTRTMQQGQQQQGQQQIIPITSDTTQLANVPADTAGMMAQQQAEDLDATLVALEQDPTGLDPVMAVGNIDGWIRSLRQADQPQLGEIADNLEELKSELQADSVDGQKVGQLLTTLGEQTTEAASEADTASTQKLRRLGELLSTAGEQLTSSQQQQGVQQQQQGNQQQQQQGDQQQQQGDQQQQQQQDTTAQQSVRIGQQQSNQQQQGDLNATLVALEQDPTGLDPVMAVGNIDGWIRSLRQADQPQLGEIADNLEELKSELQADSVDGQKVGQLLTTLGEQTTEAASEADPANAPQLLQLGDLLSTAGEQLTSGKKKGGDKG